MAKQIKFYSVSALPSTASTTGADGIYFVDNGELYKGAQRFGLGRVTTITNFTPAQATELGLGDAASGDIAVTGKGDGWVFDGSTWQSIGGNVTSLKSSWRADISDWISGLVYTSGGAAKDTFILGITADANGKLTAQTADLAKASVGDSTTTAQHGISAKVTLNRTAKPDLAMTVNAVTTAAGITSAADYFTTGSAIYNYANGLVSGTSATSYIAAVTRDATTGKLTAHAKAFPEIPTVDGGQSVAEAWKDGPYVQVVIESSTAKPEVYIGEFGSAAAKGVVTASGSFKTATPVDYSNMLPTASAVAAYVDGNVTTLNNAKANKGTGNAAASYGVSGTFTLKSDSATHDFTLYVNPITTSANINSETSLPTGKAVKDYVDAKVTAMGDVLVFKSTAWTSTSAYDKGDVILLSADVATWGLDSTGKMVNTGDRTSLTKGMEIVCTSSGSGGTARWEIIGNQNKWVDKVTGGAKTVTDSATSIALTVGTEAVTASVTTLSFSGVGTAASKNFTEVIAGGGYGASGAASNDKLPTEAAVVEYVGAVVNGNIPANGSSSASSNGVTIGASTTAGVLTDTAITITPAALNANLNASTYLVTGSTMYNHTSGLAKGTTGSYIESIAYADGKLTATAKALPTVGDGASTSSSYGVTISASTQAGVQHSANITVSPITASANMAGTTSATSMATAKAIVDYVTAKVNGLDATDIGTGTNGLSIKVTEVDGKITKAALLDNGLAKAKGDITTTSTAIVTASAVYAFVGDRDTSINTKASIGTATSTTNGVTISVSLYSNKVPTMSVVGLGAAASNGVIGTTLTNFSTSANLTTGSAVYTHTTGLATGADTSYIQKIAYDKNTGKLTATAQPFPAIPAVGGGASTSTSKGVEVKVDIAANTAAPTVTVTTTLSTTLADNANYAPTTKAVYEAMCWYSSDGSLIP